MKIIVEIASDLAKYAFPDDAEITLQEQRILCPEGIIGDLHSGNALLVSVKSVPENFRGCKYFYRDGAFEANPDYEEPPA